MTRVGPWQGRSLAFVRMMRGWPARYSSARTAMAASVVHPGDAPVGAVCWFTGGAYGDCGLSTGQGEALVIQTGWPTLTQIDRYPSQYLGWSNELGGKADL